MANHILAVKGTAFYSTAPESFTAIKEGLFFIDENGFIDRVVSKDDEAYVEEWEYAQTLPTYVELKGGQYLLPGFVDTHIHAPQWAQIGKALDKDLPTWLMNYTFPLEASYKDAHFAEETYPTLVKTLLANGTTTAQYFGTVHYDANVVLGEICAKQKQRAFIGKVVMDVPGQCPDFYIDESPAKAIELTERFIKAMQSLSAETKQGVYGVVTPRFIPTCSDDVLYGLGALAKQYDAPIQSHCSEGDWEHNYVLERTGKRDAEALLEYGLLTNRSVMAHSVFLNDSDAAIYKETGTAISHCPISNVLFANAVAPICKRLEQGLIVSMATDISGGYSPSMFDNMRQAILSSRTLEDGVDCQLAPEKRGVPQSRIDFRQAFYMATTGGAQAMNIEAGRFEKGCLFDAFIFDCHAPHSNIIPYENDTLEDILQKIVFLGQRQNITRLWVQGQEIEIQ